MKTVIYSLLLFLHWAPRILTILFTFMISFFAFDVFGQGTGFWKTLALLIHLIPTFLIIIILILSWKRPWIGGISFILLGIAYIIWISGAKFVYIVLSAAGILFLASWFLRKNIKEAQDAYWDESR